MTIRGPFAATLLVLLFLSLAANLMIVGFAIGRVVGPWPGGDIERIVAMGTRNFPPEIRRAVAERALAGRSQFRAKLDDVQAARQRMFEAMRAEPFDRAALEAAFADLRQKTDELQRAGQELVAGALAEASPETRHHIMMPRRPRP
jgi:uncharacterized membrane protein